MQSLLELSDYPTAIFASDDVMAIGVMKAIADQGKSIPGEISVVGFDNIDFSKYFNPALTTIHQPVEEMCRQALRLMHKLIKEPGCCPSPMLFRLKPELVIRQSTGPVPAEK
jgi:DNA-binding LacI/PurR family transcriptional regulator